MKKIFASLLTCVLLLGLLPTAAWAADNVPYLNRHWDENTKQVITQNETASNPTVVTTSNTTWSDGWYVASGDVTIGTADTAQRVTVTGHVRLILTDGCSLTVNGGIQVQGDDTDVTNGSANSLTIYGQTAGTGKLTSVSKDWSQAGIGGGSGGAGGSITINGGTVIATGSSYSAGIGGGSGGAGGSITINGGTVTADNKMWAAGIGGGNNGAGGVITINGGTVNAKGGNGAGIGGGCYGSGGSITINGGTVTAASSSYGAGIGGGSSSKASSSAEVYDPGGAGGSIIINGGTVKATSQSGVGIGGGSGINFANHTNAGGVGGSITISGGTVEAIGGSGSAGIGGGRGINGGGDGESGTFSTTSSGNAFITASSIGDNDDKTSWSGVIFEGRAGQIYGSPTLTTNAEIPSGKTLIISEGSSLVIGSGVTLTNSGTITNSGEIVNDGNLDNQNTITNSGSGSYSGTGTVDKSTPAVTPPTAKNGLTYDGSAQALINAGRASAGTLKYSTDGASYSTDIPTGTSFGDYTVYYKVEGNDYYNDVAEQSVSVSIAKATPTVSVAVSLSGSSGAREAALTVTVTGVANGAAPTGTVTLTDSNNLNQSLSLSNGTATYTWSNLTDGEYTVTVAYSGDNNYNAVSNVEKTFDTSKREQTTLTIGSVGNKTYGDPVFTFSTSGGSGSGLVTFVSSDPTVISVSGTTATIHKAGGPVTITATKAEDENYNAATGTLTVTVGKKAVVFKANDKTVQQGGTMPTFDYAAVTLAHGDSITKEPTATCTATNTNTAGTFDILFSGAELSSPDNYEISYQFGTLTITARPSTGGGGGGTYIPPTTPTYPPTVEKPSGGGGVPSISPSNPKQGDTVTVIPKPDKGYEVDEIIVTDKNGKPVEVTKKPDGTYTLKQPDGKIKIEVTYQPIDRPWNNSLADVSEGDWYYEAVRFVKENGLMNGYSDGRFGPNDNLSRAQFAQILFNKEGRPVVKYLLRYNDVVDGAWYTEAVRWTTSQGVVSGYGNGMFGPNDNITREQLAVMLWRYAGSPAATDKELHFTDADKASGYALEALCWAVENGIMGGYGNGQLAPQGLATRAQTAQMLKNFLEEKTD